MMKLSSVVLTYNEEANILRCLNSLPEESEIIVIDCGSTDNTTTLAKNQGAQVFVNKMADFSSQRNFGIDRASNDWVLFIDADEELSPILKDKFQNLIENKENIIGYEIRRHNYMLGKKLNYCWSPDYVLRLFNKNFASYSGKVHERAIAQGKTVRIEYPINHYTFQSVSHYFNKVNQYTSFEAKKLFDTHAPFKSSMLYSRSWAMFTQMLFGKQGFRDGTRGLILSLMEAVQSFLTYAKLYELYEKNK